MQIKDKPITHSDNTGMLLMACLSYTRTHTHTHTLTHTHTHTHAHTPIQTHKHTHIPFFLINVYIPTETQNLSLSYLGLIFSHLVISINKLWEAFKKTAFVSSVL